MRLTTGEQLREINQALKQDQRNYLHEVEQGKARIAELEAELATLKAKAAVPDRVAMAKALCNYHADLCGVSRDDQWFIFSDAFLNDVDVMLAAAPAQPQSDQDYIHLCAALYQACGAYDMPERVLDALSAAANAQPFIHLVDDILPCMPDQPQSDDVIVPRAIAERMAIDAAQYEHEHAVVHDNVQLWQQPGARLTLTVGDLRTVRALLGGAA